MAQGVTCSEPWPPVGNVRQNWYPTITTELTLLSNLATILHSVREDLQESDRKSREQPRAHTELQNSDALGHGGVGGAIQAACRQAFDREQSNIKSVLRKCFMPMISGLGLWIQGSGCQVTLKYKARYIPTDQSKKAPDEGLHTQSQTPSLRWSS